MTRIAKWLFAGLLCIGLWQGTAYSQSYALNDACARYFESYEQGRYLAAAHFAAKALALAEKEFGSDHPTTAILLDNLAELCAAQGRFAEVEPARVETSKLKRTKQLEEARS